MSNDELIVNLFPNGPGTRALLVNAQDQDKVDGGDWGALVLPWDETPVGEAWFATVDLGLETDPEITVDADDLTLFHFILPISVVRIKARAKIAESGALVLTFEVH